MLVSPRPISRDLETAHSETPAPGFVVVLVLLFVALASFLMFTAFVPVSLRTPGIESFMVGP
jgi:hypothetical protein